MPEAQPLEPDDPGRLGAYRVIGRIGEGGQGVVYLGEVDSGGPVAIKLFHARLGQDPATRDDFMRELEAAKRVARFCTAQVLDFGISGNRPYIVSEYVPGPALQQMVTAEGPRSGSALERLAIGTATALVALHDAGIIHRDFKPQNVLIGSDGPRVIDFGIARALAETSMMTSHVVGTPAYMAPEQLTAGELGLALDVFAWASTIAFAATGRPPFGDDTTPAIMNRILNRDPGLDGIEAPLRDLLAECLSKDPSQRPSAQQILDRLVRGRGQALAVSSQDIQTHEVLRPDAPGERDAPRLPVPAGEVSSSDRATAAPSEAGDASVPKMPKKRRGTRAAVISVIVAGAIAGVVGVGVALLSTGDLPASRAGASRAPQVSAAAAGPQEKAVDRGTASPPITSPAMVEPSAGDSSKPERSSPKPSPTQLAELGPGRFTAYCKGLGWEWVEYRETPKPGAYCVKRKGDQTIYLTQSQRDTGCQRRFNQPRAVHRFKGKSNYCYIYR